MMMSGSLALVLAEARTRRSGRGGQAGTPTDMLMAAEADSVRITTAADWTLAPAALRPPSRLGPLFGVTVKEVDRAADYLRRGYRLYPRGTRFAKGVFDRISAALLLIIFAPVLVAIALVIKATSHGPVLVRQGRVGVGGRLFTTLGFRTMPIDAKPSLAEPRAVSAASASVLAGGRWSINNDLRTTRVGRFLRHTSLDEVPQLINVLRGEMSLVGPRPSLYTELSRDEADALRRLRVKPGLTGLWQVSGRNGLSSDELLRLDLYYVDNWSPLLDLLILWRTIKAVVGRIMR